MRGHLGGVADPLVAVSGLGATRARTQTGMADLTKSRTDQLTDMLYVYIKHTTEANLKQDLAITYPLKKYNLNQAPEEERGAERLLAFRLAFKPRRQSLKDV